MGEATAAEILAAPSDYTVEEVLGAFQDASPAEVASAQALEADGKGRKAIADYKAPASADEPRYARDRVLSVAEGPAITGLPYALIVGALHGDDSEGWTRFEVQVKAEAFRVRTVPTEAG